MSTKKRIGIVQSRGLGDIVIALPIAHYYHKEGYSVYWPICEEFWPSMAAAAPWVNWMPMPTDSRGLFFSIEPIKRLKNMGIEGDDVIWLYQYLNNEPERTDLNLFAMMKFDQYKYAVTGLPFGLKWRLGECLSRNPEREAALKQRLVQKDRYWVIQQQASDMRYDIDTSAIDPECQIVEITEQTDNIWDWLGILEGCEGMILIDSVFANIVDQLDLNPESDRYFLRKWNRGLDGSPVFINEWTYLPVEVPEGYAFKQVDPAEQIRRRQSSS